ncbi:UNVERIFIED_CONTAM: hypothetical protein Sindi_2492800 [Sesamum indicum]
MLTRTLLRRSRSVGVAPLGAIAPVSFLTPFGFARPLTRTHVRLLGPCFKIGRMGSPLASAGSAKLLKHAGGARCPPRSGRRRSAGISTARALAVASIRATLDEIYRPIGAAFPNNPTRQQRLVVWQGPGTTGLSPSPAPLSRGLGPGPPLRTLLQTTIRTAKPPDSQVGLFPVRSPLLGGASAFGSNVMPERTTTTARELIVHPPLVVTSVTVGSHLGRPRADAHGKPMSAPHAMGPPPVHRADGATVRQTLRSVFLGAYRARARAGGRGDRTGAFASRPDPNFVCNVFAVHLRKPCYDFSFLYMIRLSGLLATSRAANRPRRLDPNTSPDHLIGRSDGRCVQRAGTPVIASNFHGLKGRSPSKKLAAEGYLRIASYRAEVSFVNGINQTNRSTN